MPKPDTTHRALAWEIVVLVFSVVTLLFEAVDTLFELTTQTLRLFFLLDTAICVVFLADVAYRGFVHPDRRRYWRWGWIDLISSLPAVGFLRWGRLVRIARVARALRAFRSTQGILRQLFRDPARGSVFTVALATTVLVVFGSVVILNVEGADPATNIRTASDALWWSFVTVTTVGYGDFYPVSAAGRIVAAVLMSAGVGLFGTLTVYLANSWVSQELEETEEEDADTLREQLAVVIAKLERLEAREAGGPDVRVAPTTAEVRVDPAGAP